MSTPCTTKISIAAIQSFSVPLGAGANLSNIGFHAPPQEPGWANDGTFNNQGYSSMPWAVTQDPGCQLWNGDSQPGTPKRLRRIRTRTRSASAHCITSGLTPINLRQVLMRQSDSSRQGRPSLL